MNQTARYIIMALLAIALAIWSITVFRSCQEIKEPVKPPEITTTDTADLEDLYAEEADTTADEFADDGALLDPDEGEDDEIGYNTKPSDADFSNGEFLVVAGAFIVEANAKKAVKKLHKEGYDDAEIRIFIGSDYHSVIVGEFEGMSAAFDVAIELADASYKDVYVHKKRHRKKR